MSSDSASVETAKLELSRWQLGENLKAGKEVELFIPRSGTYDALRVKGQVLALSEPVFLTAGTSIVVKLSKDAAVLELRQIKAPESAIGDAVKFAGVKSAALEGLFKELFDLLKLERPIAKLAESLISAESWFSLPRDSSENSLELAESESHYVKLLFASRANVSKFLSSFLNVIEQPITDISDDLAQTRHAIGDARVKLGSSALERPVIKAVVSEQLFSSWETLVKVLVEQQFNVSNTTGLYEKLLSGSPSELLKQVRDTLLLHASESTLPATLASVVLDCVKTIGVDPQLEELEAIWPQFSAVIQEVLSTIDSPKSDMLAPLEKLVFATENLIKFLASDRSLQRSKTGETKPSNEAATEDTESVRNRHNSRKDSLVVLQAALQAKLESLEQLPIKVNNDGSILFVFPYLKGDQLGTVLSEFPGAEDDSQEGFIDKPKADLRFELRLTHLGFIRGEILIERHLVRLWLHDPVAYQFVEERVRLLEANTGRGWKVRVFYNSIKSLRKGAL